MSSPSSAAAAFPDLPKWSQSTVLNAPSSLDLWASAKFIGRECSSLNRALIECKMNKGQHPGVCINEGNLAASCGKNVIAELNASCKDSFDNYKSCLDTNDYRIQKCLKEELTLINCYNDRA